MLQIAGSCALRQKHKDKKIRTQLAKTRTKESTAFRFGSSQVFVHPVIGPIDIRPGKKAVFNKSGWHELRKRCDTCGCKTLQVANKSALMDFAMKPPAAHFKDLKDL